MLEHGYDGAREVAKRVSYVLGHAALTGRVSDWAWERIAETHVFNEEVRRMLEANPWALHEVVKRLYEACRRGYWRPSEEALRRLREAAVEAEAWIEAGAER